MGLENGYEHLTFILSFFLLFSPFPLIKCSVVAAMVPSLSSLSLFLLDWLKH